MRQSKVASGVSRPVLVEIRYQSMRSAFPNLAASMWGFAMMEACMESWNVCYLHVGEQKEGFGPLHR